MLLLSPREAGVTQNHKFTVCCALLSIKKRSSGTDCSIYAATRYPTIIVARFDLYIDDSVAFLSGDIDVRCIYSRVIQISNSPPPSLKFSLDGGFAGCSHVSSPLDFCGIAHQRIALFGLAEGVGPGRYLLSFAHLSGNAARPPRTPKSRTPRVSSGSGAQIKSFA